MVDVVRPQMEFEETCFSGITAFGEIYCHIHNGIDIKEIANYMKMDMIILC